MEPSSLTKRSRNRQVSFNDLTNSLLCSFRKHAGLMYRHQGKSRRLWFFLSSDQKGRLIKLQLLLLRSVWIYVAIQMSQLMRLFNHVQVLKNVQLCGAEVRWAVICQSCKPSCGREHVLYVKIQRTREGFMLWTKLTAQCNWLTTAIIQLLCAARFSGTCTGLPLISLFSWPFLVNAA